MAVATGTALLIGAGVSAVGNAVGSAIASGAQEDAAMAQKAEARRQQEMALSFAKPTAQELDMYSKRLSIAERNYSLYNGLIEQQKKQIQSVYGEAIMEQGKQFLSSMQGQQSAVEKSYSASRERDRNRLVQQLTDRLGPGALTSSAGMQALNQFDQQTSDQLANLKESSLNNAISRLSTVQGAQSSGFANIMNLNTNLNSMYNSLQDTLGNFQTRQANAAISTGSQMIGNAGAEYVGEMNLGRAISQGAQQVGQLGATYAGYQGQKEVADALKGIGQTPQTQTLGQVGAPVDTLSQSQISALGNFQFSPYENQYAGGFNTGGMS